MSHRLICSFIAFILVVLATNAGADTMTLYLLNGTSVRGEVVDRSAKNISVKTPSGVVKLKTAKLMPVSRQQLRLPTEVEKEEPAPVAPAASGASTAETETLLTQMEILLAENAALKQQVEALKAQLTKAAPLAAELKAPAEGPAASH
jgi:hypothetical protein